MTRAPGASETAARVIESFGRRVIVETVAGERGPAELFGRRLACVCGDDVMIRRTGGSPTQDHPRIVAVGERRSLLARTDSRGRTEAMAANVSLLVVLLAPEPAPDPFIADRYLAGAALAGIDSMIVVNKTDLHSAVESSFAALIDEYRRAGYETLTLSATRADGVDALRGQLVDRVAMLVGQSGVGKSTLTQSADASFPTCNTRAVGFDWRRPAHDGFDCVVSDSFGWRVDRLSRGPGLCATAGRGLDGTGRMA